MNLKATTSFFKKLALSIFLLGIMACQNKKEQKEYFELDKNLKISVKELYDLNNRWYNQYNGFIS